MLTRELSSLGLSAVLLLIVDQTVPWDVTLVQGYDYGVEGNFREYGNPVPTDFMQNYHVYVKS